MVSFSFTVSIQSRPSVLASQVEQHITSSAPVVSFRILQGLGMNLWTILHLPCILVAHHVINHHVVNIVIVDSFREATRAFVTS